MPSKSLMHWHATRVKALDQLEHAHRQLSHLGRGSRYATLQINFSYATLLSSHFQGFCRDLHTESAAHLLTGVPKPLLHLLRLEFAWNRSLDRGNPTPGGIGSDFARLGVNVWQRLYMIDSHNQKRRLLLEQLLDWRNAIAHQDFGKVSPLRPPALAMSKVRDWRRSLQGLADKFDQVMYDYLFKTTSAIPW